MATKQFGCSKGFRLEQVTEATGGAAGTADVDVNIKTGITQQQAIEALEKIKLRVATSKNFP